MDRKVELKVADIASSQAQASAYALVLQEVGGTRRLPVIISSSEAQAIVFRLKEIRTPRPLTHDLFASVLTTFDISITEVLIYKAEDGVFYSYIFLKKNEDIMRVDARTSDAVALALHFSAPIYIYDSILEKECILVVGEEGESPAEEGFLSTEDKLKRQDIQSLKRTMKKAIEDENYELASLIRDEIQRRKE